jgi:hypothetical protein
VSQIRSRTAVDGVMDGFLDEFVALNPIAATEFGLPGQDERMPDLSPDGHAEMSGLRRRTLAALDRTRPADSIDRVTIAAAREQLQVAELLRDAGAGRVPRDRAHCPGAGNDAVGPELYALWSRSFLGFQVDLAEAYEWGPSATR